jgi:hypothetical protein
LPFPTTGTSFVRFTRTVSTLLAVSAPLVAVRVMRASPTWLRVGASVSRSPASVA